MQSLPRNHRPSNPALYERIGDQFVPVPIVTPAPANGAACYPAAAEPCRGCYGTVIDDQTTKTPVFEPTDGENPLFLAAKPWSTLDEDTAVFDPLPSLARDWSPPADHGYEPTPEDWAAVEAMRDEMAAQRYLDQPMPLAALVLRQCEFYRDWGTACGTLIAGHLAELARAIVSTKSATVSEFEARDEVLREDR